MARIKGRGQKLDKYYIALNKWWEHSYQWRMGNKGELRIMFYEVFRYQPLSDWEREDKENLMSLLITAIDNTNY